MTCDPQASLQGYKGNVQVNGLWNKKARDISYAFKKNSEIDKDQSIINQFYTGDCNLLSLLRECEEAAITMDTEKIKNSTLRRVQLMVCSGFVPDCYLDAAYKYAIGSLWVKFTPLH